MKTLLVMILFLTLNNCSTATKIPSTPVSLQKGQSLPVATMTDQHEKPITWNNTTRWILFSKEKDVNTIIHSVLQTATDAQKNEILYVADISAMPGMVTTLFALPKMRKYPYSVALDREGILTSSWPTQPQSATVFAITNQTISDIIFVKSAEELRKVLNIADSK